MPTSLGLYGDLDDVELIMDLEETFGLELPDEDTWGCSTAGDLFALIEARLPGYVSTGRCATAMTFYRLRRALQPRTSITLRPDTPIAALANIPVRELRRIIRRECGLNPPASHSAYTPQPLKIIKSLGVVMVVAVLLMLRPWLAPQLAEAGAPLFFLLAALVGVFYWKFNFLENFFCELQATKLSDNIATFGDLVREVSSGSVAKLAEPGAHLRAPEAWEAYKDILVHHTSLSRDLIEPGTLLLRP